MASLHTWCARASLSSFSRREEVDEGRRRRKKEPRRAHYTRSTIITITGDRLPFVRLIAMLHSTDSSTHLSPYVATITFEYLRSLGDEEKKENARARCARLITEMRATVSK